MNQPSADPVNVTRAWPVAGWLESCATLTTARSTDNSLVTELTARLAVTITALLPATARVNMHRIDVSDTHCTATLDDCPSRTRTVAAFLAKEEPAMEKLTEPVRGTLTGCPQLITGMSADSAADSVPTRAPPVTTTRIVSATTKAGRPVREESEAHCVASHAVRPVRTCCVKSPLPNCAPARTKLAPLDWATLTRARTLTDDRLELKACVKLPTRRPTVMAMGLVAGTRIETTPKTDVCDLHTVDSQAVTPTRRPTEVAIKPYDCPDTVRTMLDDVAPLLRAETLTTPNCVDSAWVRVPT
mmetsp:Transcript_79084/g.212236  ORF Transcript_79084/g.212236 Transcript_79084/m.212236 type:complete len:301 (+) Transcript_79084:643-1545(+)